MELPEECFALEEVQLVEYAALVEPVELGVEQLELEALDFSGLTVLLTAQSLAVAFAALVAAVATAAVGLLLLQPDPVLVG